MEELTEDEYGAVRRVEFDVVVLRKGDNDAEVKIGIGGKYSGNRVFMDALARHIVQAFMDAGLWAESEGLFVDGEGPVGA